MKFEFGRALLLSILASAALASCKSSEQKNREAAEFQIAKLLKDPSSAQFSDEFTVQEPGGFLWLCGKVNGKNSFGAYSGARRFAIPVTANSDASTDGDAAVTSLGAIEGPDNSALIKAPGDPLPMTEFEMTHWNTQCVDQSHFNTHNGQ